MSSLNSFKIPIYNILMYVMCPIGIVSSVYSIAAMSSVGICVMTAPAVCIGTKYYYYTIVAIPYYIIASSEFCSCDPALITSTTTAEAAAVPYCWSGQDIIRFREIKLG